MEKSTLKIVVLSYLAISFVTIWLKITDQLNRNNKIILSTLFFAITLYYFLEVFINAQNLEGLNGDIRWIDTNKGKVFNVLINEDGTVTTDLKIKGRDEKVGPKNTGVIEMIDKHDRLRFINKSPEPKLFKILRHEMVCPVYPGYKCSFNEATEFYRVLLPNSYAVHKFYVKSGNEYHPGRKNSITTTYELVEPETVLLEVVDRGQLSGMLQRY